MGSPSTRTHQIARALEAHFEVAVLTTPSEAAGFDALDEQRSGFLLESDLGVAAHLDLIETRFAYRARLLDYFWAGLPTVTTRGDTLGEFVSERQFGPAVGFRDVAGWTAAISELIDDGEARRRASENLEAVRSELAWPRSRSSAFCERPRCRSPGPARPAFTPPRTGPRDCASPSRCVARSGPRRRNWHVSPAVESRLLDREDRVPHGSPASA